MQKKGLYASALVKKTTVLAQVQWGDDVKEHFVDKIVGSVDTWPGMIDGVSFYVFSMKEPNYVTNIMSTYGTLNEIDDAKTKRHYTDRDGNEITIGFKYTEVFNNHYKY